MSSLERTGLVLVLDRPATDGRTRIEIDATPVRLGSDANRADVTVDGLDPLHAVVAPVKGGGFGLKVGEASAATLDGQPVRKARVAPDATLTLGPVTIRLEAPSAEATTATEREAPRAPLPTIPGYRVEKQLGRGAMGRVYLATQESLDRKVALKVLEERLANDAAFVQRFQSEARAAAALHHSNIVTVFDVGAVGDLHYLALEYMDRGSLEDRLVKEGPLPWRAVLGVLRDAAAGLEFAEGKRIVHRDIKPDNLMQNQSGVTKIVDLGLATSASEAESSGKVFGTAHFMAPEQARGHALDARADLYALGASAWRLLTAKTPFTGENSRAIVKAVLTEPPPPLADRVPDLPADVEALVLELMAKDPDERPASARELRQRVEALIQRHSTPGGAPASADDGSKSKLPLVLGAVAVVVLAVVGVLASGALGGGDEPGDPGTNGTNGAAANGSGTNGTGTSGSGANSTDPNGADPNGADPNGADPNGAGAPDGDTEVAVTGPGVDEDDALKQLEREAERALLAVDAAPDDDARRARLEAVVADFPGTTAASTAAERLAALDDAADPTPVDLGATELSLDELRTRELARRTTAARDASGAWRAPQEALTELLNVPLPPRLVGDEATAEALEALRAEVVAFVGDEVAARRDAARALVDAGDFDAARTAYADLVAWLTRAPEPAVTDGAATIEGTPDATSPAPTYLVDTIVAIETEAGALDDLAARYEAAMTERDRDARRARLFEDDAFRRALARFDTAAAVAVLEGLEGDARSRAGRAWARRNADALAPAQRFDDVLRTTFDAGEWRRLSIAVPGERRDVREVVGIDGEGFLVEADGQRTRIGWDAFADSTELLDALVSERLDRGWNDAEAPAIATGLVVAAINECLAEIGPVLAGDTPGSQAAQRLALACERAGRWVDAVEADLASETLAWLRDQLAACERAAALVTALAGDDLGQAAWAADELIVRFEDTLLGSCVTDASARADGPAWPPTWP